MACTSIGHILYSLLSLHFLAYFALQLTSLGVMFMCIPTRNEYVYNLASHSSTALNRNPSRTSATVAIMLSWPNVGCKTMFNNP